MSIRARVEDAAILYSIGRPEGSLLAVLIAIAATSRRRRPKGTASVRNPGALMGDGEAFEAFLNDEMERISRVINFNVEFRGHLHRIEHIFYKWLRCDLAHEATMPSDVAFEPDPKPTVTRTGVRNDGTLVLSHGWLDGLVDAVIHAPENADQFGIPPAFPLPIELPRVGLIVGGPTPSPTSVENESKQA